MKTERIEKSIAAGGKAVLLRPWPAVLALALLAGCATVPPPAPPPSSAPRVVTDGDADRLSQPPPAQQRKVVQQTREDEMLTGDLVRFNQVRTVLATDERIELPDGRSVEADEIRPLLEDELVERNFRIFSEAIPPGTDVAELTRKVRGHLLVKVVAESRFVNTTGKFSKFRAKAEAQAIRGRDGTKLSVATAEATGPRKQDPERAGQMALRDIAASLVDELVNDLMAKSDQLLWSALVVRGVDTSAKAKQIESLLEAQPGLGYVELLGWDENSRVATYEIMHGRLHDSDILQALSALPGVRVQVSEYEPDRMQTLRRVLLNFK